MCATNMLPSKQSEMKTELHIDSTHAGYQLNIYKNRKSDKLNEPCSVRSANVLKGDCGTDASLVDMLAI